MHNILIVDDDKIERNGIYNLLLELNNELNIYQAKNGKEALLILEKKSIDILVTDISMPCMDGIELSRKAKIINKEIIIILISAHSEFEYARDAISIEVSNYLLKPIDFDEFNDIISLVFNKIEARRNEKQQHKELKSKYIVLSKDKIISDLILNGILQNELKNIDFFREKSVYVLVAIAFSKDELYEVKNDIDDFYENIVNFKNHSILVSNNFLITIFDIADKENITNFSIKLRRIKLMFENVLKVSPVIIISNPIESIENINSEYLKLKSIQSKIIFKNETQILFAESINLYDENNLIEIDNIILEIEKQISIKNYELVKKLLNDFMEYLKLKSALGSLYIKYIFSELIKKIYSNNKKNIEEYQEYIIRILELNNIQAINDLMFKIIDEIIKNEEFIEKEKNNYFVDLTLKIINEEYFTDIGVEYIAKKIFLTPNYLGQIFKKTTGKSIKQQILEKRMEIAKKLLLNSSSKISDISTKIGFSDVSYFIKQFNMYYGVSPAQYRSKTNDY